MTTLAVPTAPADPFPPGRPTRPQRWLNGGVHWVSGVVLLYAFVRNGETSGAMFDPAAMRGEVRLGLAVAALFLARLVWVYNRRVGGGRWAGPAVRLPRTFVRRASDWGIYLGVAIVVGSGLLIWRLRPGATVIPGRRGLTDHGLLNAAIRTHVHAATALEWLCAFHAAYAGWYWLVKRSRWGPVAEGWVTRALSAAGRAGVPPVLLSRFR